MTMAKAFSKKLLGVGHTNPVGSFKKGTSTLKNTLAGVADAVSRIAKPKRRS
jgi:hypothetical protein